MRLSCSSDDRTAIFGASKAIGFGYKRAIAAQCAQRTTLHSILRVKN